MHINQIIKTVNKKHEQIHYRIVGFYKDKVAVSDLSLKTPKRPFTISLDKLNDLLRRKIWAIFDPNIPEILFLDDQQYIIKFKEIELTRLKSKSKKRDTKLLNQLEMRDKAWETIKPLVTDEDKLVAYLFGEPNGILEDLIRKSGRSKKYVAATLNRFFKNGGFKNALLPEYYNCGKNFSLPKEPQRRKDGQFDLSQKPGPAKRFGSPHRHVTQSDVKDITAFVRKNLKARQEVVKADFYADYLHEYASIRVTPKGAPDEDIKQEFRMVLEVRETISQRSFIRQVNKLVSELVWLRKKVGQKNYERDHKARTGSASYGLRGATSRYEIDSTVLDIYIRYEFSNELLSVGRPVLYLVVDVVTGMIVGMHVSFLGAGWTAEREALLNAFSNKVEFCAKYGVIIEEKDWPCSHVCSELTLDRGTENTDANMEAILKGQFGISTTNLNAYHMGVCKGTVENNFDVIQKSAFSPLEHGKVFKVQQFDRQHPSRNAILTYKQLVKALIECILYANNQKPRVNNRTFEMERDGVAFTSLAAWNYSLKRSIITPATVSFQQLVFGLLSEKKVSVEARGVKFDGLYYSSKEFEKLPLLDQSKNFSREKISIRYSQSSTNHIWWRDKDTNQVYQLDLTERCQAYRNQEWIQVHHRLAILKHELECARQSSLIERVLLRGDIRLLELTAKREARRLKRSQAKTISPGVKDNQAVAADMQKYEYQMVTESVFGNPSSNKEDQVNIAIANDFSNPNAVQEVQHG
ncbi:transposase [Thalassotalea sp. LPB0316]|uniref:transposase n=1 Tax=Thalassotalea sp. LPB0316 TaxID=2769490 RepID=UPI001867C940|nr:transposase [Thalassotalea sp. LPB0316]QOL25669.1 transposase [Thalassotalea sp. LPB0316]